MDSGRFVKIMKAKYNTEYLPSDIAHGKVRKTVIFQNASATKGQVKECALLELEPGAEIICHQHTEDTQRYLFLETGRIEFCVCGDWHGVQNNTNAPMSIMAASFAI